MNIKQLTRPVISLFLLELLITLSGCASTHWINSDATKDWKHDLDECNFNAMKSVCTMNGANVVPNCITVNGNTSCKPSVVPASNSCHDELQLGPRDACLQDLGWVKSNPSF